MTYDLNITKVVGVVAAVGNFAEEPVAFNADNSVFDEHGKKMGTVQDMALGYLKDQRIAELFRREGNESHTHFVVEVETPRFGSDGRVFVEKLEPRFLRPIDRLEIRGAAVWQKREFRYSTAHWERFGWRGALPFSVAGMRWCWRSNRKGRTRH